MDVMRIAGCIGFPYGPRWRFPFLYGVLCGLVICSLSPAWGDFAGAPKKTARKLYLLGMKISRHTHYLEALDPLEEAKQILEKAELTSTRLFADVTHACAQVKIKGRLHQNFPAYYVKSALKEARISNQVRERLPSPVPQQLADGYFLEGFIQKRFFRRMEEARKLFEKAVAVYPGHVPAKRFLSELQ